MAQSTSRSLNAQLWAQMPPGTWRNTVSGIKEGAEVDAESRYKWTALMFACWKGHEEVAVALLEAGADPNHRSTRVESHFETVGGHPPSSPLREAMRKKHFGIVRALIDAGARFDGGSAALAGYLLLRSALPKEPAPVSHEAEPA